MVNWVLVAIAVVALAGVAGWHRRRHSLRDALSKEDLPRVERLLADSRRTIPKSQSWACLSLAIHWGDDELCAVMLQRGADPNERAPDGDTPLRLANSLGFSHLVRLLLSAGARPEVAGAFGMKSLDAVLLGRGVARARADAHLGCAKMLLEVLEPSEINPTLLGVAVKYGDGELADALIHAGAPVSTPGWVGPTPLHWATRTGNEDVVRVLLGHGADARALDDEGKTPLFGSRTSRVCALLLAGGAEVNVRSADGETPLHEAAAAGLAEVVEWLLRHGADATVRDAEGRTAGDRASGYPSVRRLLDMRP